MNKDTQTFIREVNNNNPFRPEFKLVKTIEELADAINLPHHDDYPKRVPKTIEALNVLIEMLYTHPLVEWADVCNLHRIMFADMEEAGSIRKVEVYLGEGTEDTFFKAIHIDGNIQKLFPLDLRTIRSETAAALPDERAEQETLVDIADWYKAYLTIHPFRDGNGRTAGVVFAAIMYHLMSSYVAPLQ